MISLCLSFCFLGIIDQLGWHPFTEELTKTFGMVPSLYSYLLLLEVVSKSSSFLQRYLSCGFQCRITEFFHWWKKSGASWKSRSYLFVACLFNLDGLFFWWMEIANFHEINLFLVFMITVFCELLKKSLLRLRIWRWFLMLPSMCAQLLQLCPTLCYTVDLSRSGSSVHGIFHGQEYWSGLPLPAPPMWSYRSFIFTFYI